MVASPSPSSTASSSTSVPSGAHQRRLTDVERASAADCCGGPTDGSDDHGSERRGHGAGAGGVKALLLFAWRSGCRRVPVAGLAWARSAVACLLGAAVILVLVTSSRGGAAGGAGRPLVRRVDAGDGGALGWREENLTAVARRPPDPPKRRYLAYNSFVQLCYDEVLLTTSGDLGPWLQSWQNNQMITKLAGYSDDSYTMRLLPTCQLRVKMHISRADQNTAREQSFGSS